MGKETLLTDYDVPSALSSALELDGLQAGATKVDIRQPWHQLRDVAFTQLSESLLKKWQGGRRPSKDACEAAKKLFLHSNLLCAGWEPRPNHSVEEALMGETRQVLLEMWPGGHSGYPTTIPWADIAHHARCGPGAAVGAKGDDFYTKLFASPLASSSRLLTRLWQEEVSSDPRRIAAELDRIRSWGHGITIRGSRLAFAPKNATVARCICTEPVLGIYYQLGFGAILEKLLLKNTGIRLDNQPSKNRELARLGSITGGYATIDLSSASDSMSTEMLRWALPRQWFYHLMELRSPYVSIGHEEVELKMVSSMGNGFTFPLQTMFFSAVVLASFRVHGLPPVMPRGSVLGNWGVFGDDIIVPTTIAQSVIRTLNLFGFRENAKKTFVEGPFRESCGHDYYRGQNVRGVYIKRSVTLQDRASSINQLLLFSTRTGLPVYHLVRELRGTARFHFVPRWENDDAGLKVPLYRMQLKLRRSKRYQSYLYRCWRAVPRFLHLYPTRIHSPPGHRLRVWNPEGAYLSFLRGAVNADKIGLREEDVRYRTETGVAPWWDAPPPTPPFETEGVDWQRWETVVYLHLFGR